MNAPDQDPKPKPESELDYAPPWVREQATRQQPAREQPAREQAAGEQAARDQFRATLRQSGGLSLEQAAQKDPATRILSEDRPWRQRALEPELVPAPAGSALNLWPMMLRLGAVCTVAAPGTRLGCDLEVIEPQEESGKFRPTWHHAGVARGGAALRLTATRVAG